MLGKGLESLIPKKGGQGGPGDGASANAANFNPTSEPALVEPELSEAPVEAELPAANEAYEPELPAAPAEPELPSGPEEPFLEPALVEPELPAPDISEVQTAVRSENISPAQPHVEPHIEPQRELRQEENKSVHDQKPESIFQIETDKIRPNPGQPRRVFSKDALEELARSIREFGFLQPLVVTRVEKESPTGVSVEYELIAGERRLMAAKMLGLHSVPAIVRNVDFELEKLELAIIENIQRENLNPIETARAYQRLQEEFRLTQREVAAKLGKSRESVANAVRLLDLPEYIRTAVEEGKISESHARFLLAVTDPAAQRNLFDDIIEKHLTTRDVKERLEAAEDFQMAGSSSVPFTAAHHRGRPPKNASHLPPELRAIQESLSSELGTPVEIYKGQSKGSITITFYSEEELRAIMQRLGKEEF